MTILSVVGRHDTSPPRAAAAAATNPSSPESEFVSAPSSPVAVAVDEANANKLSPTGNDLVAPVTPRKQTLSVLSPRDDSYSPANTQQSRTTAATSTTTTTTPMASLTSRLASEEQQKAALLFGDASSSFVATAASPKAASPKAASAKAASLSLAPSLDYSFAWSVATQKGYRYPNGYLRDHKFDIHAEMEDMHYPSHNESPNNVHPLTGRAYQLFMIADGHGGHECARYAIVRLPAAVIQLVNSRAWDVHSATGQQALREEIQRLFLTVDQEYCERKLEQFRRWIEPILAQGENPNDIRFRPSKPADDGCTLVVNLLYDGVLINCNVGDSRSLLLRSSDPDPDRWVKEFASTDHTPGHPVKAQQITANGGRYMMNGATLDVSAHIYSAQELHTWDGEVLYESKSYDFLSSCRIGRPAGWKISEIDVQASTTLNLAGTMGDLFFKYHPALITACPDVTFTPMFPTDGNRYMLVMATDGLWDHMRVQLPGDQEFLVAQYIERTMADTAGLQQAEELGFFVGETEPTSDDADTETDDIASPSPVKHSSKPMSDDGEEAEDEDDNALANVSGVSDSVRQTLQKLGILAHGFCDREMVTCRSELFAPGYVRYDDVTAFVVVIEAPPPAMETVELGDK